MTGDSISFSVDLVLGNGTEVSHNLIIAANDYFYSFVNPASVSTVQINDGVVVINTTLNGSTSAYTFFRE